MCRYYPLTPQPVDVMVVIVYLFICKYKSSFLNNIFTCFITEAYQLVLEQKQNLNAEYCQNDPVAPTQPNLLLKLEENF